MKFIKSNNYKTLRATITLKVFTVFIVLLPFTVWIVYLSGFKWIFYIAFSFIIYFLIFLPFSVFWRKVIKKEQLDFENILGSFLYKISTVIFISFVFFWSFSYYNNVVSPAKLQIYTLESGNKTVIFQTMSHVWSKKFYKQVEDNIKNAKERWYVLFYEWVKINKQDEKKLEKKDLIKEKLLKKYWNKKNNGRNESNKKLLEEFNEALWIKFDKDLYKNFSKLYWLVAQDNIQFLGFVNDKDFNIDLTLEKLMKIYREKMKKKEKNETKKIINLDKVKDVNKDINELLKNLNKRELKVLVWVNKSMMNFLIKNENFRKKILELSGKQDIMWVIVNDRDENLAQEIQNSNFKKIYVIYWMMHFEWVFERLKNMDKTWKIIDTKEVFFIN